MARRGLWSALKDTYRKRLMKKGITEEMYNSGASLSAARGHAHTPEHPEDAYKGKNAEKYAGYRYRRAQRKNAQTRKSAIARARDYAQLPEWRRKKPYWPGTEETAFWKEYQKLGGSGGLAA
jgi:hypothetical protein